MPETALVTGGTGFVAGWCIVELLRRGFAVRTTVRSLSKKPSVRAAIATAAGSSVDRAVDRAVGPAADRAVVPATDAPANADQTRERLTVVAADLTQDEGWDAAVAGCDYVLHVASPLGWDNPRDANALIVPAREGTLRVLRAATRAGVRRVVMTSAAAAARRRRGSGMISDESDETVWSDPTDPQFDPYRLSKILAERAAWDFIAGATGRTALTTILPGAVFGPVLTKDSLGSAQVIQRLLHGRPAGLPRLGFSIVDVRDLADLHIRAMTSPAAAGERFIAVGDFLWMQDIARTLRSALGPRAARVPTRALPNIVVKLLSVFVPPLRRFTPDLGRQNRLTSAKARRVLGFSPRPGTTTVIDCAESLVTLG